MANTVEYKEEVDGGRTQHSLVVRVRVKHVSEDGDLQDFNDIMNTLYDLAEVELMRVTGK